MKPEETERYHQKIRAFAIAILNELALEHTVSMREQRKQSLGGDDTLVETGEGDPEQVRFTIDGIQPPRVRFSPVYPHYDSKKPWTGKIEVRVDSSFISEGRTVRGYTWVEKSKPLSPVKMAQMLVSMTEARKLEADRRRESRRYTQKWEEVHDGLREKFPRLPRDLRLRPGENGIAITFETDNTETIERLMEVLQTAVQLGRVPGS